MKKIFVFTTLLLQLTMGFGQYGPNKDCAESGCGSNKGIIRCWGNPQTFPEFPGIVVRVKGPIEQCFNGINDEPNRHSFRWYLEIKGSTNALFRVDAVDGNGKTINLGGGTDGECIYPFEITQKDIQAANDSRIRGQILDLQTFSNAETINIKLIKCVSSFQGTNTKSNTTVEKKNDLTEYNRSKAEMEQKVQEENTRRQQEATQLNNQKQQFKNVYNEGVQLGNTGKYSEAAAKYQQAIGLATNDADRQTAQNAYNKISKVNQQTQTINEATTAVVGIAKMIDQARAKSKIEKDERTKSKLSYYDLDDNELFEAFVADVFYEFKKKGYKLEKIGQEYKAVPKNNFSELREIDLNFKDFDLSLSWYYGEKYGEIKALSIICKNEKISKDLEKIKILDKWATKKNKATYSSSLSNGVWYSKVDNIEFDRSNTKDLSLLILQKEELNNFKKYQDISSSATLKNLGVEIPIETSNLPETNITVKSIIDKYIDAIGGYENIKFVSSITQTIKNKFGITKITKGFGKLLSESTQGNFTVRKVFNGLSGYSELNGKKTPLPESEILELEKTHPFEILELEPSVLQLGKIERINGTDCYTVLSPEKRKVISGSSFNLLEQKKYYFEKETGLWRAEKIMNNGVNFKNTFYIYLKDYRIQNKIYFPFTLIFFQPEDVNSISENSLSEIKINEAIADPDFNFTSPSNSVLTKSSSVGSLVIKNAEKIKDQKVMLEWDFTPFNSASETKDYLKKYGFKVNELESYFSEVEEGHMLVTDPNVENKFVYLRFLKDKKAEASLQEFSLNGFPFFPLNSLLNNFKFIDPITKNSLSSIEFSEAIVKEIAMKGDVKVAIKFDNGNVLAYRFFVDKNNFTGSLLIEDLGFIEKGEFVSSDYEIQFTTTHAVAIDSKNTSNPKIGKILPIK